MAVPGIGWLAAKAGASYVSPFAGRIDDDLRKKAALPGGKNDYFPKAGVEKDDKPVTDGGIRSGVQLYKDQPVMFKAYIGSLERIKDIQAKNNVDAIVSIHAALDSAFPKMEALKSRKSGDPHPFVSKDDVDRFSTVLLECAKAKQAWFAGS